jgi:RHH-type proline utilization regulon transcriptional repressor/proline dehydrogenase/delta 1-pyrroline-5-carboxylate dehydrogenase
MSRVVNHESRAGAQDAEIGFSVLAAFAAWAMDSDRLGLAWDCERFARLSATSNARRLAGPSRQTAGCLQRRQPGVLCVAESDEELLTQLACVLALGSKPVWATEIGTSKVVDQLPALVRESIVWMHAAGTSNVDFDVVLYSGDEISLRAMLLKIMGHDPLVEGVVAVPMHSLTFGGSLGDSSAGELA